MNLSESNSKCFDITCLCRSWELKLIEDLKNDYLLYTNRPDEYKKKVDSVSELFRFSGSDVLLNDYLPTGFSGNYNRKDMIAILGINPGFAKKRDRAEENEIRKESWDSYRKFHQEFYKFFKRRGFESPYYTMFWHFFSGLNRIDETENKWDFFDQNVLNLNLIPYHSVSTSLPSKFNGRQEEFLEERFANVAEFARKGRPRLWIFNGKPWHTLIIEGGRGGSFSRKKITDKFSLYMFEFEGAPAVLFDKFFSGHYWGITKKHRMDIIPRIISRKYPDVAS